MTQRVCLFIAPLKGEETVTRERSQDVYELLVSPACLQSGYTPKFVLSDDPGTVMSNIFSLLKKAWVIVADLTGGNGSVMYELAFAHMQRKPTIPIIQAGHSAPYDVRDMKRVEYDYTSHKTLRNSVASLVRQLSALPGLPFSNDNPIQNALKSIDEAEKARSEPPALRSPVGPNPAIARAPMSPPVAAPTLSSHLASALGYGLSDSSRTSAIREIMKARQYPLAESSLNTMRRGKP